METIKNTETNPAEIEPEKETAGVDAPEDAAKTSDENPKGDLPKTIAAEDAPPASGEDTVSAPPPPQAESGGGPPPPAEESDPVNKMFLYGGAVLALLVLLVIGASMQNTNKYYVVSRDGAVEVWQGRFSPMGRKLMVVMPGVEAPADAKTVYTKRDVYPMIFQYYLDKSDALMDAAGAPDFAGIKSYLRRAAAYATTAESRATVNDRLKTIDRTILIYKADVEAGRGTLESLQAAKGHLSKAAALQPDEIEASLIRQKMDSIQKQIEALKAAPQEPPQGQKSPPPSSDQNGRKESGTLPAEKVKPPSGGTT